MDISIYVELETILINNFKYMNNKEKNIERKKRQFGMICPTLPIPIKFSKKQIAERDAIIKIKDELNEQKYIKYNLKNINK